MRELLGIPTSALVICRHGGLNTFNMRYVHKAVEILAKKHKASVLQFLFMSTAPFLGLPSAAIPHVRFLPATSRTREKELFFQACDAMLHAREQGESFGLAVAEMAIRGLPILTHSKAGDFLLKELGDYAMLYSSTPSLVSLVDTLVNTTRGLVKNKASSPLPFANYTPRIVMEKFRKVFLEPILGVF